MPLFTKESSLHHVCQRCAYFRTDLAHDVVEYTETPADPGFPPTHTMVIECPSCGTRECFNCDLEPGEEGFGHLGHQQQAQHIRLLQKHLGHALWEERYPSQEPGTPTSTLE
jgi:hypothetical protein